MKAAQHLASQSVLDKINRDQVHNPFAISDTLGVDAVDRVVEQCGTLFWEELQPLQWHRALVDTVLSVPRVELGFLSNPHVYTHSGVGKRNWLRKHGYDPDLLVLAKRKDLCAASNPRTCLIDDIDANVVSFEAAGGQGFCWPNQQLLKDSWSLSGSILLDSVRRWLQH